MEILDEKVNAHFPYYSTMKSSGKFSSKRFKLECSSSVAVSTISYCSRIWSKPTVHDQTIDRDQSKEEALLIFKRTPLVTVNKKLMHTRVVFRISCCSKSVNLTLNRSKELNYINHVHLQIFVF